MEKGTVEVYEFGELDDKAKEKVRLWLGEGGFVTEELIDYFATELQIRGLAGLDTHFSLGNCQGDGVAFEGSVTITPDSVLAARTGEPDPEFPKFPEGVVEIRVTLTSRDNHYTHWNSFSVDVLCETIDAEGFSDEIDPPADFEEAVTDYFRNLSRTFEKDGYEIIEYRDSDEALAEDCEANDYRFNRYGEPIHHLLVNGGAK